MTATEKALADLSNVAREIRDGNNSFKASIENRIGEVEAKIDRKLSPVYLEKDILSTAQQAIAEAIKSSLAAYDSPFKKLVSSVIDAHNVELRGIINDAFSAVIKTEDFKASIVQAFAHKVSRSIIANNDSLFDKVSNELKQDPQFKARLTLAVAGVVEETLKQRQGAA